MKRFTYKRKYLIQNPKEALFYLRAASPSYKSNIYQFYCDQISNLGVLSLRFDDEDAWQDVLSDTNLEILANVTEDKRYKNRYLKRFGFPDMYDFELEEVYPKCDKLVGKPLELSLMGGMSAQKVFKVLFYFESISLRHAVRHLLEDEGYAVKMMDRHAKNIAYLLKIGRVLFDTTVLDSLYRSLKPLLGKDRTCLLAYVQGQTYQTFLLDMHFFLMEKSGFYLKKESEMPILLFVKKFLKKERFRIAQQLKKALD